MKRIGMMLLLLALVSAAALADVEAVPADATGRPSPAGTEEIVWDYDELVVGSTTPLSGAFYTGMWGNMTSDVDVRMLLHGYNLVEWESAIGGFAANSLAVSGLTVTQNEAGDHIYSIALYPDLLWSDGTPITAWDYAFSWMLESWPGITELGAAPADYSFIAGMQEWRAGTANAISGIRVLSDTLLEVTIRADYLPYFFELGMLACAPSPVAAIAPDTRVADDGEGVYLAGAPLTADGLRARLLGDGGYVSHPSVTSGPYRLVSYDGSEARFERNPYYKGDAHGVKPTIERIVFRNVNNEEMISLLASGEVGLLNKCTAAEPVAEGIGLVSGGDFAMSNYARVGFSFLSFSCERPAVSDTAVRKAIALCLDKDRLVEEAVGSYGLRVDGYYGIGQWMVQLLNGTLAYPVDAPETEDAEAQADYEAALAEWEALSLDSIPALQPDAEEAARMLESAGWTADPESGVRGKTLNGENVPLSLVIGCAEESGIAAALEAHLLPNLTAAGIRAEIRSMPFGALMRQYYRQEPREVDLIFAATNFDVLFDPAPAFQPDGDRNWTALQDPELYALADGMRHTEPGDLLGYCRKWLAFQQRFSELMPMIPVYSNVYFDFYPTVLQNYVIASNIGWSKAIVGAYMSDVPEENEDELEFIE